MPNYISLTICQITLAYTRSTLYFLNSNGNSRTVEYYICVQIIHIYCSNHKNQSFSLYIYIFHMFWNVSRFYDRIMCHKYCDIISQGFESFLFFMQIISVHLSNIFYQKNLNDNWNYRNKFMQNGKPHAECFLLSRCLWGGSNGIHRLYIATKGGCHFILDAVVVTGCIQFVVAIFVNWHVFLVELLW